MATYGCGHSVCGECALNLHKLDRVWRCTHCKGEAECTMHAQDERVNDRNIRRDTRLRCRVSDRAAMMISRLENPPCPVCGDQFEKFSLLKVHLEMKEGLQYCGVCLENRPLCNNKQRLYRPNEVRAHLRQHHSYCVLCSKYFYDLEARSAHLRAFHERCEICV